MPNKFALGQIVATPGALDAFEESGDRIITFIARHVSGDWGDLCDEDKKLNDEAINPALPPDEQGRVLSAYYLKDGTKIWIVTEWDRSVTTLLKPEEY